MFVDGPVHLKTSQMTKDEELRTLLRKRGYRILELYYDGYSDNKRDQLYKAILNGLRVEPGREDFGQTQTTVEPVLSSTEGDRSVRRSK